MGTDNISDVVFKILEEFGVVLEGVRQSDQEPWRAALLSTLQDDLIRFKIWSGNSGAHRNGRSSLEHRLRDASHIRKQILSLLCDLQDMLRDAIDIITGRTIPWDKVDSIDDVGGFETGTEIEQIGMDITEIVDCLFRLSVTIQNPAPHDRYMQSRATDILMFEQFDRKHVQEKFCNIQEYLAQRLGKATSRRRSYFKYRQEHHNTISYGLDRDTNTTELAPSTSASSVPLEMKDNTSAILRDDCARSDTAYSQTSYASSGADDGKLRIPSMPEMAYKGPFECPFCYRLIHVDDTLSWKRHVFGDLRPYNCLAEKCKAPDQDFATRKDWMEHMLQSHLRVYRCFCGCGDTFSSAADCRRHISDVHSVMMLQTQIDASIKLSSHAVPADTKLPCPFCQETLNSLKQYRHHVGSHQQQLALFALPSIDSEVDATRSDNGGSFSDSDTDDTSSNVEQKLDATSQKVPVKDNLVGDGRDSENGSLDDTRDIQPDRPRHDLPREGDVKDFVTFGNSLQVKDGILRVSDDLLKNDGKRFIEMLEQLAERRMAREKHAEEHIDRSHSFDITELDMSMEHKEMQGTEGAKAENSAKVLHDFAGDSNRELTVQSGDIVETIDNNNDGWSLARNKNAKEAGPAWIPTAYVEQEEASPEHLSGYSNSNKLSYETPTRPVKEVRQTGDIERLSATPRAREQGEGDRDERFPHHPSKYGRNYSSMLSMTSPESNTQIEEQTLPLWQQTSASVAVS